MCDTRWSAHASATSALNLGYHKIKAALKIISDDTEERANTRQEARGLQKKMDSLECATLSSIWGSILERMNKVTLKLQNPKIDLNEGVKLLQSLYDYLSELRFNDSFQNFEAEGILKSGTAFYKEQRKRKISCKITRYGGDAKESEFTLSSSFKINVYIPILDNLLMELKKRMEAYKSVCNIFGFLSNLVDIDVEILKKSAKDLRKKYPDDFDESFSEEITHFQKYIKEESEVTVLDLFKMLIQNKLYEVFPNTYICFKMYLSLMITNCSGERSFSALNRIKNYLRSKLSDWKLNNLAIMHIESDVLRSIDTKSIINNFVSKKMRKCFKKL